MDRRKFIHAASALGTVGFMSTANAEGDGKSSLEDVGIKNEVATLLREGKTNKLKNY